MKKTIREWLNELPEGIREKAINNTLANYKKFDEDNNASFIDDATEDNMTSALYSAFIFGKTPEGFSYWNSICHNNH